MNENQQSKHNIPADQLQAVLGLLTLQTLEGASTCSVYTSRQGRIWISFKRWGDEIFSSSCECDPLGGLDALVKAIGIAATAHMLKLRGRHPHTDTWVKADRVADAWQEVQAFLASDWSGEAAGAPELEQDPPTPADSAMQQSTKSK